MSEKPGADSANVVPVARVTRRAVVGAGAGLLVAACGGRLPAWKTQPVETKEGFVELETGDYPELVAPGGMVALRPAGARKPVLVMRIEHDQVRVMSLQCPHMGCVVRWDNDDQTLRCPCHGSSFDDHGNRVGGPAKTGLQVLESQSRGTRVEFRLPQS
jgi:Rieske Fe-S protein